MSDQAAQKYAASKEFVASAHVNAEQYRSMYRESVADPEYFWGQQGKRIVWIQD